MLTVKHAPARIVTRKGHTWWMCPHCERRTLAEIRDGKAIIKSGDRILVVTIGDGISQRCPNVGCGEWSVIGGESA